MNVIGSRPDGWWKDRRGAMIRLVSQLETFVQVDGHRVTVVFEQPTAPPIRSALVEIREAARAGPNSADDEIVRLVCGDEWPQRITVVTSDGALAGRVRNAGAAVHAAAAFRNRIDPPRRVGQDDSHG